MQTNHARRFSGAFLLAFLSLATGCDGGSGDPGPETGPGTFTIRSSKVAVSETVMQGTFEASGTIVDQGDVREVLDSPEPLNLGGSIYGRMTLVSNKGSITIEYYAGLIPVDRNTLRATGGFRIEEGTGAYTGLQGGGDIDREVPANASPNEVTRVLEGVIHAEEAVYHASAVNTVPPTRSSTFEPAH